MQDPVRAGSDNSREKRRNRPDHRADEDEIRATGPFNRLCVSEYRSREEAVNDQDGNPVDHRNTEEPAPDELRLCKHRDSSNREAAPASV
jgi:hypothetical protein